MGNESLAVYLVETGRTEKTDRVDVLTPRDENGVEMVVSIDSNEVIISTLCDSATTEKLRIILSDVK